MRSTPRPGRLRTWHGSAMITAVVGRRAICTSAPHSVRISKISWMFCSFSLSFIVNLSFLEPSGAGGLNLWILVPSAKSTALGASGRAFCSPILVYHLVYHMVYQILASHIELRELSSKFRRYALSDNPSSAAWARTQAARSVGTRADSTTGVLSW